MHHAPLFELRASPITVNVPAQPAPIVNVTLPEQQPPIVNVEAPDKIVRFELLTAQGHPRAIFNRAIERGNLLIAETTLREIGRVTLVEALQLTALIAVKDPRRHARVSARWLARYLEARDQATIDEAAHVVGALVALGGAGHEAAYAALLDVAERASRRPARGVA